MKHDFEEYFPLPWSIKHRTVCYEMGAGENFVYLDLNGESSKHVSEGVPSLVDFTARGHYDHLKGRDETMEARKGTLEYLVQCANLMPEAARLLNEALRIIEKACIACANIDAYHCGLCGREETTREIKALLAKLEGGAETE